MESGFTAHLNIGAKTVSLQGGTLRGQTNATVRGTTAGNFRIGGGNTLINGFDAVRGTITGKPVVTFFAAQPLLNGATLDMLKGSSPRSSSRAALWMMQMISSCLPSPLKVRQLSKAFQCE